MLSIVSSGSAFVRPLTIPYTATNVSLTALISSGSGCCSGQPYSSNYCLLSLIKIPPSKPVRNSVVILVETLTSKTEPALAIAKRQALDISLNIFN